MATNAIEDAISSRIEPPEIAVVVDIDGSEFSGQINFTLFGSLVASTEVNVDYDLNRLENLTISRLLDEINCVLLPAMQIRFMPGTTDVAFGEYGNMSQDVKRAERWQDKLAYLFKAPGWSHDGPDRRSNTLRRDAGLS